MLRAADIMSKKAVTVKNDTSVQRICEVLTHNRMSGVPVVNEKNKLVGFISERDIIMAVNKKTFIQSEAGQLMTKKVFCVKEDMPVDQISRIFTEKPYRYVPVVKNNKVIGIISRKDVISKLLGQYY
jgi:CBS domain-containing protein